MTLTLIKNVNKEDLLENQQYTENPILSAIYNSIDNGRLNTSQMNEFQRFVTNILNSNTNVVNKYFLYENENEEYIYEKFNGLAYDYDDIRDLRDDIYRATWDRDNETIRKYLIDRFKKLDIKGIRDNTPLLKLINIYLKSRAWDNDSISQMLEKLQYKVKRKYILHISNTGYAQLTSTYTDNYSSCYNLNHGEYRSSNVFLMGDNRNYIIKIFQDTEENRERIENDTLKVSKSVISRFNLFYDGEHLMVNKIYGSTEYTINRDYKNLVKDILDKALDVKDITIYDSCNECENHFGRVYCNYFEGYEDYECNSRYINNKDRSTFDKLGIGSTEHITWDIYQSDMIMRCTAYVCECCGYEVDYDDDLYYCEDTGDYRCDDCCWWCDNDCCYYSNNTDWVRIPSGERYRYNDCDFS